MEVSDKVSMANYRANRLVCEAADRAMQVHGGVGYSRHEPFEHIYRHHRRYRITEGAEEIQMRRVAQRLFKFGSQHADVAAETLSADLTAVLRPLLGDDVDVENLRALTGGASRTTWAFDAVTGTAAPRADPAHRRRPTTSTPAWSSRPPSRPPPQLPERPCPTSWSPPIRLPHWAIRILICDEIAGETIVRRIQRQLDDDGRRRLLAQCAQALAAIHRARPDAPGLARAATSSPSGASASTRWATPRRPSSGRFAGWPPTGHRRRRRVLVHGDFRMGNLIVDELRPGRGAGLGAGAHRRGLRGPGLVLHPGLAVRRPGDAWPPAGWAASRTSCAAYEAAGGRDRRPRRRCAGGWCWRTLRWGVICRYQAERHLSGQTRSVELAAIGRRVCETEWDVLDLLESAS